MECVEVQELLSSYFDDELSADVRSSVAEHAQACSRCGEELAGFEQMSTMARGLDDPEPPGRIWAGIEAALDADQTDRAVVESTERPSHYARRWRLGLLTTAALVLVATGVVWMATTVWHAPGHHDELAADFDQYLESFNHDPVAAQNILLAKYDSRPVNVTEATDQLGYRPAVAGGLPAGYSLESMHVLDMPCCKCLKTLCRRNDGKMFAIFEHEEEQPIWFGDRPRIDTQCNGRECSVIGVDRGLVASWKSSARQLTVVGAHDLEEITDLVAHFQSDAG
jgi:anti-sigma factor RsiW